MITVRGLSNMARNLSSVRMDEAMRQAAKVAGAHMLSAVQAQLASGEGHAIAGAEHVRSHLYDSVEVADVQGGAVIGTSDRGASFLELGTRREMPQPFLAPAAMQHGADVADAAGETLAQILAGIMT